MDAERTEALDLDCVILNRDNNDSASGPAFLLQIFAIFSCCSGDNRSLTGPNVAGKFRDEIAEFLAGVRGYYTSKRGKEREDDAQDGFRQLFSAWNTFLQPVQGVPSDIEDNMKEFILRQQEQRGEQWTEDDKERLEKWLPRWNMFLQARAGQTLVTRCSVYLTIGGFLLYVGDQATDIGTAIYYAYNGQWRQAVVTLLFLHFAVFIHASRKWWRGQTHCTGAADCLWYAASSLVNWPDVKFYWTLCQLERRLHRSPAENARLVPEWHRTSYNVALLKLTEGDWEAFWQATVQLGLLVPDLYGAWTWTDYLRVVSGTLSMCSAALSHVNREKYWRIFSYIHVPLSALVVLHVWAMSVTVSRLLSFTLILIERPLWAMAGLFLHLALYGAYLWRFKEDLNAGTLTFDATYFLMSPFAVVGPVTARRVLHAVHLLGNTGMTVVWALGTPLVCAHPALYTAIICLNAVMFAVGVGAMVLHEKHWPGRYSTHKREHWILLSY